MKRFYFCFLLSIFCFTAAALPPAPPAGGIRNITVDTNGILLAPTNFLAANLPASVSPVDIRLLGGVANTDIAPLLRANLARYPEIHLPAGTWLLGSTVTVTNACRITGAGRYATQLQLSDRGMVGFQVRMQSAFAIEHLSMTSGSTQTNGAAVTLDGATPGASPNHYSRLCDVLFDAQWIALDNIAGDLFTVDNCAFTSVQSVAIRVDNVYQFDAGDSQILNSSFGGGGIGVTGIVHRASSGLRICNNKFFPHGVGYLLSPRAGIKSGQLYITANSFEPSIVADIMLTGPTSGSYQGITVAANQIHGENQTNVGVLFTNVVAGKVLSTAIVGNQFSIGSNSVAVLADGSDSLIVQGNELSAIGGTSSGVIVTTNCTYYVVGLNQCNQVTTNYNLAGTPSSGTWPQSAYMFGITDNIVNTEQLLIDNGRYLSARNAAKAAFKHLIGLDTNNVIQIGDSGNTVQLGQSTVVAPLAATGNLTVRSSDNDAATLTLGNLPSGGNANARKWMVAGNYNDQGLWEIMQSTTAAGQPSRTVLKIDRNGLATFLSGYAAGGNLGVQSTDNDSAGLTWWNLAAGANVNSRAWKATVNNNAQGMWELQRSADSTSAPNVSQLSLDSSGRLNVGSVAGLAGSGAMNVPNNSPLSARNAAGSNWIPLISLNASDMVVIGDGQSVTTAGALQAGSLVAPWIRAENNVTNGISVTDSNGTNVLVIDTANLRILAPALTVYTNNAGAVADGLKPGTLYRTGGDPDHVCIVH